VSEEYGLTSMIRRQRTTGCFRFQASGVISGICLLVMEGSRFNTSRR
jgi:hypothetical protein